MIALAAFDMRAAVAVLVLLPAMFAALMVSSRTDRRQEGEEDREEHDDES